MKWLWAGGWVAVGGVAVGGRVGSCGRVGCGRGGWADGWLWARGVWAGWMGGRVVGVAVGGWVAVGARAPSERCCSPPPRGVAPLLPGVSLPSSQGCCQLSSP